MTTAQRIKALIIEAAGDDLAVSNIEVEPWDTNASGQPISYLCTFSFKGQQCESLLLVGLDDELPSVELVRSRLQVLTHRQPVIGVFSRYKVKG